MEELRGWIINICTAIFFMTAVEMLMPDNKMKKYSKFVLGLILITVLINPLVKFLNHGAEISTYINRTAELFNSDTKIDESGKYKESNIRDTLAVFKTNLEKSCKNKLKDKYPKDSHKVNVEVDFDRKNQEFLVKGITIEVSSGGIERVKKVEVKTASNYKEERVQSELSAPIKELLSNELKLSKDVIKVYKAGT